MLSDVFKGLYVIFDLVERVGKALLESDDE